MTMSICQYGWIAKEDHGDIKVVLHPRFSSRIVEFALLCKGRLLIDIYKVSKGEYFLYVPLATYHMYM